MELLVQNYEHFMFVDTTAILFSQELRQLISPATNMKGLCQENRKLELWSAGTRQCGDGQEKGDINFETKKKVEYPDIISCEAGI